MIHIVEISADLRAQAWFAYDEDDFNRKVRIRCEQPEWAGWTIYQQTTPRQLAAENVAVADELAKQFGLDTPLYRADFLLEHGRYQAEEIPEFKAGLAAVANTCHLWRIYLDDATAADALLQDAIYQEREGLHAHLSLRDQLIAMEILADDF